MDFVDKTIADRSIPILWLHVARECGCLACRQIVADYEAKYGSPALREDTGATSDA